MFLIGEDINFEKIKNTSGYVLFWSNNIPLTISQFSFFKLNSHIQNEKINLFKYFIN